MTISLSTTDANAALDAIGSEFATAGATITIYSGTRPTNADTALSGNTALVTFTLPAGAFGSAASKAITMTGLPITGVPAASGTASFARASSATPSVVFDASCGVSGSGADIILDTTSIATGTNVQLTSGQLTIP